MATAAPPPLASSRDKTNGAKLSRLLIDGGTTVLRKVFDGFHPPASLAANLNTNYSILNNLFRRGILKRPQWDKLFPPSGASPDSKTFDITLLFLLLTSICGLFPPPSGWHTKPPLSDNSLEANLARIKFFRNELYGHVTTTGIPDPTFAAFWQEIGDALVALGLDKAEITRLRAEHSGEEAYLDVLYDWIDNESDIKTMLKKGYHTLTAEITKVQNIQQEERKTLHEVKKAVDTFQDKIRQNREDDVLKNLAMSDFTGDINYHVERFQTETRKWIFEEVQNWLDDRSSRNRVMVISGQAGMGKSVIAAVICKRMQESGRLSGSHFCQHNNVRYRNPKLMLQSLAFHLSCSLPEYKEALVKQLSRNLGADLNNMGVEDLFALLFKEPLASVPDPGRNILMVIDGLDESEFQGRNELLDVIAVQFCKLPLWMRFLVTTRPEKSISTRLSSLNPFELKSEDKRNFEDVQLFFERRISSRTKPEERASILSRLVQKSEGLMLYASYVVEFIENNVSLLRQEDLERSLPLGISAIYQSYFKRLESEFQKELNVDVEHLLQFLCAVLEARGPLPISFIFDILGLNTKSQADQRNLQKCINCLSSLFLIRNNHLHIAHKSVKDWLTDKSTFGEHQFTIEEGIGHRILSRLCAHELDIIKSKGIHVPPKSDTERYALQHGVQHMLQTMDHSNLRNQLKGIVESYICDPELLYAKLYVEDVDPIDDLHCVQEDTNSYPLGEECKSTLQALLIQFKKHGKILRENPQVIFQTLLNEENIELSSKAAAILEAKYPEMPYLEVLDKRTPKGPIQARFDCTDTIVCFDVSPNLEHMVCECKDGMILLWSIHSGKREWMRSLAEKKHFEEGGFALRWIHTGEPGSRESAWSVYRSVVFHPSGEFVLPGELNNVYTLSGDSTSLFPTSNCRFSVCSFSGDKTRMLTDCPDSAREMVVWDTENGEEITRMKWKNHIISFDLAQSGSVAAFSDSKGAILVTNVDTRHIVTRSFERHDDIHTMLFGLLRFQSNDEALVCGYFEIQLDNQIHLISNRSNPIVLKNQNYIVNIGMRKEDKCPWRLGESVVNAELEKTASHCTTVFYYMLGEQSALVTNPMLSHVTMSNVSWSPDVSSLERHRRNDDSSFMAEIAFAVDGTTVYTTTQSLREFLGYRRERLATVTGWTIRSGDLKLHDDIRHSFLTNREAHLCSYVRISRPLREGVLLLQKGSKTVEVWNNDFSKCVLPRVNEIEIVLPISEELVGCLVVRESCVEVHVLRIKSFEEIVLERVLKLPVLSENCLGSCVACSSEYQIVLMFGVKDGNNPGLFLASFIDEAQVWRREPQLEINSLTDLFLVSCMYSPREEFVAVNYYRSLEIVDPRTGENLHTLLKSGGPISDYKFLCDGHSLVCLTGYDIIRMFDVKSGELLTVMDLHEEEPMVLAASLREPLIAVGFSNTMVKLIRVKMPGVEHSRKAEESRHTEEERGRHLSLERPQKKTTSQSWCTLW